LKYLLRYERNGVFSSYRVHSHVNWVFDKIPYRGEKDEARAMLMR